MDTTSLPSSLFRLEFFNQLSESIIFQLKEARLRLARARAAAGLRLGRDGIEVSVGEGVRTNTHIM